MLTTWRPDDSAEERCLSVLRASCGQAMTEPEIAAAIALWKGRDLAAALLDLLLEGSITATRRRGVHLPVDDWGAYTFAVRQ